MSSVDLSDKLGKNVRKWVGICQAEARAPGPTGGNRERLPAIIIPGPWRGHTAGQKEVVVHGATVGEALADLVSQYPTLAEQIFGGGGEMRSSLHLFLGETEVQSLQGQATKLTAGDRLVLVLPIGGGNG